MLRRILVSFFVSGGEWDPDECTRALSLSPTDVRRRGQPGRISRLPARDSEWVMDSPWRDCDSVDDVIRELLDAVWPARDAVVAFCRAKGARAGVVVAVEVLEARPIYEIGRATIERLAFLGAEVSFDIYDLTPHAEG